MKVEPELFRVEVWFYEPTETIQIKRTDPGVEHQCLSCTLEQWEQIKYAVDHLFEPDDDSWGEFPEIREITASRN
jgi:hypothetical protein